MDEKIFLVKLKEMLHLERDISMTENLTDIEEWDSFSYVAFMAMAEDDFEVILDPLEIKKQKTVANLYCLLNGGETV